MAHKALRLTAVLGAIGLIAFSATRHSADSGGTGAVAAPGAPAHCRSGVDSPEPSVHQWLANHDAQRGVHALGKVLARAAPSFGHNVVSQLQSGLIGSYADDDAPRIVVVVDPTILDPAGLRAEISDALDPTSALAVRVESGCNTAEALIAAEAELHDGNKPAVLGFGLDAETSTIRVTIRAGSPANQAFRDDPRYSISHVIFRPAD